MTRLPFELFLGLRYLKPKRTFVSVITLISLAGVTIGVWVLIVVIAVMSGFDRELRDKLMGMQAEVTVTAGGSLIEHGDQVLQTVLKTPHVKAAAPFAMSVVLVEFEKRAITPFLKGIDPQRELTVSKLGTYIKEGKLDLNGDKVLIGQEMASQYGIFLGDKITVYSPRNIEKKGEEAYLPMELTVTGIFESGMYEYDVGLIFTSLETAQELFDLGNAVHGIEIRTDDPIAGARDVADTLNRELPPPLQAQTWAQMNQRLLGAIQVEKSVMFFILTFIIIVAAFGIMSTLITVTVQKTREIGMMKALGAASGKILRIFVLQGFIVGVFGVAIGIGLGLLTVQNINPVNHFLSHVVGIDLFPRDIYNFPSIPAFLTARDLLTIGLSALVICTLAGLLPALRAARLEPVEALRYE
ncbi:MAG TPA: ABC transporter permease [Verrucomicrobiae bacterium]|nr:ABC transporter permease [Verrucomicrobiae bacterium]